MYLFKIENLKKELEKIDEEFIEHMGYTDEDIVEEEGLLFSDLKLETISDNKIKITDIKLDKSLVYSLNNPLQHIYYDDEYKTMEILFKMRPVLKDLMENNKISFFTDTSFFFNKYGEFLIENKSGDFSGANSECFSIGQCEVEFSRPSGLFNIFILFSESLKYDNIVEYFEKDFFTLKIRNVNKDKVEDCLQQTIFYLNNLHNESYSIAESLNEYYEVNEEELNDIQTTMLSNSKVIFGGLKQDTTPFSFFNYAKLLNSNESFIWYYKVLEFYFMENRAKEIDRVIDQKKKDYRKLLFDISQIYKDEKGSLLKLLLSINLPNSIVQKAYSKKLIPENNIENFSSVLYQYRNKIVHGKKEEKFELLTPYFLSPFFEEEWNKIIEEIAFLVIIHFLNNEGL